MRDPQHFAVLEASTAYWGGCFTSTFLLSQHNQVLLAGVGHSLGFSVELECPHTSELQCLYTILKWGVYVIMYL
jgi:hypothetical protein